MTRSFTFLLAMLLFASGCGQLSNEDLIFLAAVPSAQEIELIVEDPLQELPPQALAGEPAVFYAHALEVATFLNGAVADLLGFVDSTGQGYPPTQRTRNARIWGPFQNVDGDGFTLRFEIRRNDSSDGSPLSFSYCLHLGQDASFFEAPIGCEDTLAAGLNRVLWGTYEPRNAVGGARSGQGNINLNFDTIQALGAAEGDERGLFEVDYDFTAGGEAKDIQISWHTEPPAGEPETLSYDYSRNLEGEVLFFWQQTFDVLTEEEFGAPFSDAMERLTVNAQWTEGQGGSADVQVAGGDLGSTATAQIRECWDGSYLQVYLLYEIDFPTPRTVSVGDPEKCPQGGVP